MDEINYSRTGKFIPQVRLGWTSRLEHRDTWVEESQQAQRDFEWNAQTVHVTSDANKKNQP